MLKHSCLIISFLIILSFASALSVLDSVEIEREMPETAKAGETIQVKLNLKFTGETPSGLIVTEFLPEGWKIKNSVPAFTEFEGKASWLLYGSSVKNSSISYELVVPENFTEPQLIQGNWETLSQSGLITGKELIVPLPETEELKKDEKNPEQDYTMIIIAGIIAIVLAVIIAAVIIKKKK